MEELLTVDYNMVLGQTFPTLTIIFDCLALTLPTTAEIIWSYNLLPYHRLYINLGPLTRMQTTEYSFECYGKSQPEILDFV